MNSPSPIQEAHTSFCCFPEINYPKAMAITALALGIILGVACLTSYFPASNFLHLGQHYMIGFGATSGTFLAIAVSSTLFWCCKAPAQAEGDEHNDSIQSAHTVSSAPTVSLQDLLQDLKSNEKDHNDVLKDAGVQIHYFAITGHQLHKSPFAKQCLCDFIAKLGAVPNGIGIRKSDRQWTFIATVEKKDLFGATTTRETSIYEEPPNSQPKPLENKATSNSQPGSADIKSLSTSDIQNGVDKLQRTQENPPKAQIEARNEFEKSMRDRISNLEAQKLPHATYLLIQNPTLAQASVYLISQDIKVSLISRGMMISTAKQVAEEKVKELRTEIEELEQRIATMNRAPFSSKQELLNPSVGKMANSLLGKEKKSSVAAVFALPLYTCEQEIIKIQAEMDIQDAILKNDQLTRDEAFDHLKNHFAELHLHEILLVGEEVGEMIKHAKNESEKKLAALKDSLQKEETQLQKLKNLSSTNQ